MSRRALHTGRHTVAAILTVAVTLTACQHDISSEPATPAKDTATMNLSELPTLKETQMQMLELLDAAQREIVREVPATAPWRWNRDWMTIQCVAGLGLYFPNLISAHALTDDEWARIFPLVTGLAERAGLSGADTMQNASGNHDVRIGSADGRELMVGSRDATVLTATISCRRSPDDSLWVNGKIPLPPDPRP